MKKDVLASPDVMEIIIEMRQQLNLLDKKLDTLINKAPEKSFNTEQPKPFRRFEHSHRQNLARPDNNYRGRVLHKAICADCNKECEVPFKPSQDRPVYCKDCFSKRKLPSQFKGSADNKPRGEKPFQANHTDKPHGHGKKRFPGKKRPAVKRRKARSKAAV